MGDLLGRKVRMVTSVPAGVSYEEVWPELEGFGPDDFYGMLEVTPAADDDAGERILGIPTAMAAPGTLLDLAALHILTTSTLATLAAEHPEGRWDDRRFRPNILFDDGDRPGAYGEDGWIGCDLQIGEQARVHIVAPTPRCVMPTLEQGDLGHDHEILRTVARVNRRQLGELGSFACAGAYAEVVTPGVVRTGDPVTVTSSVVQHSALADAMEMIGAGMRARE
ncbi:MAG: MOSC domain-containing protein [Acidimicrobiia bacterium]